MTWARGEVDGPLGVLAALDELQDALVPAPPCLAVLHLRWWQDQILFDPSRFRMPAARHLARMWGWGEKRVRLLLQKEEDWSDPTRLEEWRAHRGRTEDADRTRAGRSQDAAGLGATKTIAEDGRTEDADRTHVGRAKGDTRDDPPSPSTAQQPPPSPLLAEGERERRIAWVAAKLHAVLEADEQPDVLLERMARAEGELVDAILRATKPQETLRLGVKRRVRAWPDAPAKLRKREIVEAFRRVVTEHARGPPRLADVVQLHPTTAEASP